MKYCYSLLEGLVFMFNLDGNKEWALKVIEAKKELRYTKNVDVVLNLFGGKGTLNDHTLFLENEDLKYKGQAWFEELCCYILKVCESLKEDKNFNLDNILVIRKQEKRRILRNREISNIYSDEKANYYQYQLEANELIMDGLRTNNIERAIKQGLDVEV